MAQIDEVAYSLADKLRALGIISVKYDNRTTQKPGWKLQYELKGVPRCVAIGPKDLENGVVELARRDTLTKETQPLENVENYIKELLIEI